MKCDNCGRKIGRHEDVHKIWSNNRSFYLCTECATLSDTDWGDRIFTRLVFSFCCGVIALAGFMLFLWARQQPGLPAEYYSFTNIKTEPWHKFVCMPPLVLIGILTVVLTRRRLPE